MRRSGLRLGLAALLLAGACQRFDDTPRQVASEFWEAMQAGDHAAARAVSTPASATSLAALAEESPLQDVDFGEILRNEQTALVETTAVLEERGVELTFNTHLAHLESGWKVDAAKSRREITRAALAASVAELRRTLSAGTTAVAEQVERSALEISETMREALEDVEREILGEEPEPSPAP